MMSHQRGFTKLIPCLRNLSYAERLAALQTKSLLHRRLFLDLVFLYKLVHGLCGFNITDIGLSPVLNMPGLRN